ncbi:MAG: hypothetical protein ABL949_07405 [Fimbriimonadaceae bacterium]
MKSSPSQLAAVTAALAAFLAGCSQRRDCVDQYGNILPDSSCKGRTGTAGYPHWIYGGSRSGGRVIGGSTTPRSSSSGGFGSGTSSSS